METKANFALLGGAALLGAALIMLFAMWLANSEFRAGVHEYDIVFDDPVRGLAEGGEVRFNGIKVGEVQELRIDADNTNRVIARVRISADIPVRADSTARLEPIGLTGVTLIQLTAGSQQADLLRPGAFGPPPRIVGHGSQIDVIVERGEDIVLRAGEAMAAVRDLLTDENIARVSRIIADLEVVSRQLAAKDGVITQSGEAAAALAESARAVTALTAQSQTDLHLALVRMDAAAGQIESAAQVAADRTLPELAYAAEDIRRASVQLGRFAQSFEESPSLLSNDPPRPTVELSP